jgi:transcriptional regulator with XRE-family HTH domain
MSMKLKSSTSHVKKLLERSRMPRNQVAAVSGLSNAYIRVLERGETASVKREKLISFAVALNLDLFQTDELLTGFDRTRLSTDDIPNFIETSRQVKISSAMLPLRDAFLIELVFLAIERVPGDHIIVNDRPTSCLRPEGFRSYSCRNMAEVHPIHSALIEEIGRERKRNLLAKLDRYKVHNYICRDSLEEYIRECRDPDELMWRKKHIETTLEHLRHYDRFKLFLTKTIPSFLFSLKLPSDPENENPKLAFIGKQIDFFMGKGSGRLAGFATDNQVVIENFKADVEFLKENVLEECMNLKKLKAYLESLLA